MARLRSSLTRLMLAAAPLLAIATEFGRRWV